MHPTSEGCAPDLAQVGARALEQVKEAVALYTPDIRFVWVNHEFTALTGYPPHEIVGQPLSVLRSGFAADQEYPAMLHQLHEQGHWQGEVWRRKRNGELFPALLTVSTLRDADGELEYFMDLFIDMDRMYEARSRLEFMINHDALTELPNRRLFWDRFAHLVRRAQRYGTTVGVVFLDLDNFKAVNDLRGHTAGDRLLIQVADALRECLRDADTIARVGGDEFAVLLETVDPRTTENEILARINAALTRLWPQLEGNLCTGISLGIALYPRDGSDPETLYAAADRAMYQNKLTKGLSDRLR